jgi:hypothetical protein
MGRSRKERQGQQRGHHGALTGEQLSKLVIKAKETIKLAH